MTVRFFPGSQKHKTSLIAGFLKQFRVAHEMVRPEEYRYTHHLGSDQPGSADDGNVHGPALPRSRVPSGSGGVAAPRTKRGHLLSEMLLGHLLSGSPAPGTRVKK